MILKIDLDLSTGHYKITKKIYIDLFFSHIYPHTYIYTYIYIF